jgi:hypothetical protein
MAPLSFPQIGICHAYFDPAVRTRILPRGYNHSSTLNQDLHHSSVHLRCQHLAMWLAPLEVLAVEPLTIRDTLAELCHGFSHRLLKPRAPQLHLL